MKEILLTLKSGAKVTNPYWKAFEIQPEAIYIKDESNSIIEVWNNAEWQRVQVTDE